MCLKVDRTGAIVRVAVLLLLTQIPLPAYGAQKSFPAELVHTSDTLLDLRGGAGPHPWVMRYGSYGEYGPGAKLVLDGGNRAWFSHGGWLRLIDTEKGVVLKRWHFPGKIMEVAPAGPKVQVKIEEKTISEPVHLTITLDPAEATGMSFLPTEQLILSRISVKEVSIWKVEKDEDLSTAQNITAGDAAKKLLPDLEEAVKRDPTSPWLQVVYARLLRVLGDPNAGKAFDQAVQSSSTDYTELLPISGFLDRIGERDAARAAYERGYANFLERGNDPRLLLALINRIILYVPWAPGSVTPDITDPHIREVMERIYRLAPRCEAADLAWSAYSDDLQKKGMTDEAATWRARAEDAGRTSIFLLPRRVTLLGDRLILIIFGSLLAGLVFPFVLFLRYMPQRRADAAVYQNSNALVRIFSRLNLQYWTRSQRVAFFSIVLVGWVATGWEVATLRVILRASASPLTFSSGSLAGPSTLQYLESREVKTPETNLYLAVAYQQSGQDEKAAELYRTLPEYAESWNNLGVLQKKAGKDQDARQSFQHALDLDPNLNEASFNLGQPPQGLWTALHQKYLPGRAMLAPPRADRLIKMFLGIPFYLAVIVGALFGPAFGAWLGYGNLFSFTTLIGGVAPGLDPVGQAVSYLLIAAMIFSVIMLFRRPRPVNDKPGGGMTVLEFLFPGISPGWSIFGGLVLMAWCQFLVGDYLLFYHSSPYIMTFISLPNLERTYPVPGAIAFAMQQLKPGALLVYWVPAVLLVLNGLIVLRSKRAQA